MSQDRDERLDSWKEIAAYLRRSVRTVRRWERSEALPVHRHAHHALASVYANRSEIDAWLLSRSSATTAASQPSVEARAEGSIAVLPFANLSGDAENEYFAEGLTEEIRTVLSKMQALRVTSGTSSRRFRASESGARAIASQLGVRYLLEGSVRHSGEQLRITAQLIDAARDIHLWAGTFDGKVEEILVIQERIARDIASALQLRLSRDEERELENRSIDSFPAFDCYLRARHEAWRWRKDAIDRAVILLQEGLEIIGDNARLYAALGQAYLQYREAGIDFGDHPIAEAEKCAEKLMASAPGTAPALQLRGWIHYSRGAVQDAVRDLKSASEKEPNNSDTLLLLSNCYLISGRVAVARPLIERLLTLDPLTPVTRCMPAWADVLEGNLAAAVDPYRQMFEMDPSNPMARLFYVWVLALNRDDRLVQPLIESLSDEMRDTVAGRLSIFLADALRADKGISADMVSPQIDAVARATDVFPRMLAHGYAIAGMKAEAIRWLSIAVERGFINYPYLAIHDPVLRSLRGEPQLDELLRSVHDRWQKFEA